MREQSINYLIDDLENIRNTVYSVIELLKNGNITEVETMLTNILNLGNLNLGLTIVFNSIVNGYSPEITKILYNFLTLGKEMYVLAILKELLVDN